MDVEKEIRQMKEQQAQAAAPVCCCWPAGTAGSTFWGLVLLVVGAVWLLSSLGLAVDLLWSLVFVGAGLYFLLRQN